MILCCGESLIDMIPMTPTDGQNGFAPHPGGSVFNTAIALGRLGMPTGMLTGISDDMFGQQLLNSLKTNHVSTDYIVNSARPTTLAFVQLNDGHATYSFFDENSAGRMLSIDDMPDLPTEINALYFGGISLVVEPCADAYADLLKREATNPENNQVIMLDPNIRTGFINNITRYRARLEGMMQLADIIKVSDEDLNWILPEPIAMQSKIDQLLQMGPSVVILTRGGEGATGYLANGNSVLVKAAKVSIKDTVGAGDTFNAGVLAKLSELGGLQKQQLATLSKDTLEAAMNYGALVAAVTVSREGANPPWAGEL